MNFEISKTCGENLQKEFRVAVCKKLNRFQYPHIIGKMIRFCKVAKLAVLQRIWSEK